MTADLQVGAAGVVGQALAGEQQRALLLAAADVLEADNAWSMARDGHRCARHCRQQWVLLLQHGRCMHHRDLDAGSAQGLLHVIGEALGCHAFGVGAAQVFAQEDALVDCFRGSGVVFGERAVEGGDADLLDRQQWELTERFAGLERFP